MASKHFDPHTSFIHLPVVKLTVLILFSISIFLSTVIVFKSDIEWDFSYNGFNDALVIFRFPLGILATIIPIVALLAANHRSEQTKEQIRVTNAQNIFSNYYKHMEEFSKYLDPLVNNKGIAVDIDTRYTHSNFFSNAKDGDYSLSSKALTSINSLVLLPYQLFELAPDDLSSPMDDELFNQCVITIENAYSLLNRNAGRYHYTTYEDEKVESFYLVKSKVLISDSIKALNVLIKICSFSQEYVVPEAVKKISSLNINNVHVYNTPSPFASNKKLQLDVATDAYQDIAKKILRDRDILDISFNNS